MTGHPTSIQYGLGVEIGRLVVGAVRQGASYDEVIATLEHSASVMRRNRAFGIDITSVAPPDRHPATSIGE